MQITPNDVSASKGQLNSLDPKVLQLINRLANKPLLIEKLVLNQAQGILLKIASKESQINLQLPLKTASLFENISQNSLKLSLTVNNQQHIRLQLSPANTVRTNNQPGKVIIFQNSSLLPKQILKLDNPKPTLHNSNLTVSKHSEQNSQKLKLNTEILANPITTGNQNKAQATAVLSSPSLLPSNSLESNLSKKVQQASSNKPPGSNEITLASAVKQLLKNHFSKQLPVSKHLININNIATPLIKLETPGPLEVKLQNQLKHLSAIIQKPLNHTASEIKQRIENSGHMLERNLNKQLVQTEQEPKQPGKLENQKFDKAMLSKTQFSIEQKKTEVSKPENQPLTSSIAKKITTESTQNNDVKLLLMKIRATLESIIKPVKQSSSEQNKALISTQTVQSDPKINPNGKQIPIEKIITNPKATDAIQTKVQLANQQQMIVSQASKLLTEVKNIVSQIESNQLLSLKNEAPNLHQFLVDLPLKNNSEIDSFEMLFEHSNTQHKGQKVKRWKVVVRFDLAPLGPMFARVELENGRISSHFFAQSQQTAQLINQHLHVLKKSLFSAGVNVDKLEGSQGKIPERLLRDNERLVDTHA